MVTLSWADLLIGLAVICGISGVAVLAYHWLGVREDRKVSERKASEGRPEIPVDKAMPIDPDNPPKLVSYQPRDPDVARTCSCHGRLLTHGQAVYWWPRSDISPGVVVILCADVLKDAKP